MCIVSVVAVAFMWSASLLSQAYAQANERASTTLSASTTEASPITEEQARPRGGDMQEVIERNHSAIAARTQNRIYNLVQNIVHRMSAAVERLTNIATRIDSRADKLAALGANVDAVKAQTGAARQKLDDASRILASDLGSFIKTERPRERFRETRVALQTVKQDLLDAHEALRQALSALKDAARTLEGNAARATPAAENASSTEPQ